MPAFEVHYTRTVTVRTHQKAMISVEADSADKAEELAEEMVEKGHELSWEDSEDDNYQRESESDPEVDYVEKVG